MKKKLTLLLAAFALSNYASAQLTVIDLGPKAQMGYISAIDFNNNGTLDVLVSGQTGASPISSLDVFANNGSATFPPNGTDPFTAVTSGLAPLFRNTSAWNDINQDGIPDLITNGFLNVDADKKLIDPFAGVYTNNGAGVFTAMPIANLPQIASSCIFADLNNDGYMDIVVLGNNATGKSKVLLNNKAGGFIVMEDDKDPFGGYEFVDPQISIVDFDNDKDLDFFVTAGYENGIASRFSMLFKNDLNNTGVFIPTSIAGLISKGYGSSTWGDYNGDGFPDLLINGDGGLLTNEADNNYRVYKNNGDGTFTIGQTFSYRQINVGNGGAFLDWNNDGKLDIVIAAFKIGDRQATDVYLNDGAGNFTEYIDNASIPGVSNSSVDVGDANDDGQLDLFITGFSNNVYKTTNPKKFNRNVSLVILNPNTNPNLAPTVPTDLAVSGNSTQLNFSWTAATDVTTPQASLTYNFYLKDANGKWFYSPLSDIVTGKTKAAKIGNVQYNKGWIVKDLPEGSYTWGVQAVDNSFVGSDFVSGSFTIDASGTLPVVIGEYKAFAEDNNAVIKWQSLTETNTNRFVVERSTDGNSFTTIATISAEGNSRVAQDYLVRDKNPASGTNYYRLTSIDNDGETHVFNVIAVNFEFSVGVVATVYPNPVSSSNIGLLLRGFQSDNVTVSLSDVSGREIESRTISTVNGDGNYAIVLRSKPVAGVYYLKVSSSKTSKNLKVIFE